MVPNIYFGSVSFFYNCTYLYTDGCTETSLLPGLFWLRTVGTASSLCSQALPAGAPPCGAPPCRGSPAWELRLADFCGCSTRARQLRLPGSVLEMHRLSCFTASRSGIESYVFYIGRWIIYYWNQQGSPVLVHFYKYLFDSCSVQNLSVILFEFKEHLCIEGKEWKRMK